MGSECVLVYIQPMFADDIIQVSKEICLNPSALHMFVTYEQCNPDTAFGKQMVRNLRTRGCALMGLDTYKTIPEQEARYIKKGYAKAKGWTMNEFTDKIMTDDELKRLAKLEIL